MEFAQLLKECMTQLPNLPENHRFAAQEFLDVSHELAQVVQNLGQLKTRDVQKLRETLQHQRKLSDQLEPLFEFQEDSIKTHFQGLLKKSELLAASLELALLDIPDYPLQQLMPGSKRLKDIMRSFYTHPKLNHAIEQWLSRYDLLDKIDPGEVILNGLRILTRSLAMGNLRSEEKALPFLLATCKNHIRDLRQSPQFKGQIALDDRMATPSTGDDLTFYSDETSSEALPYDQFLQAKIRPFIQQVVHEIKGKCRELLLGFFKAKFAVDFSTESGNTVDPEPSSNYVYECLGRLRARLIQEKELLTTLQNLGFHVR